MSPPLISIVIPCYNAAEYVGEAIESALEQTYEHVEVVVVDDGSTDNSVEVLKSFGKRIHWETGPNRGACAARNRGVELASGNLVQFLDADDLLHQEKLAKQIDRVLPDDQSLVFCDGEVRDVKTKDLIEPLRRTVDPTEDPVIYMLRGGMPTPAPLHRRSVLAAAGGFREQLPCAQERDLHLRLACMGLRFQRIPESLYTVRRLPGSVSSDSTRVLDQHSDIVWHAYGLLESSGQLTEPRLAAMAGFLASDARAYLKQGLHEKAKEYFAQARRIHPAGGIPQAYGHRTRWLYHLLGPAITQRLATRLGGGVVTKAQG